MKVCIAQLNSTIGDISGNLEKILDAISFAKANGAEIIVTPETCVTGYPPEDFLLQDNFIAKAEEALPKLIEASKGIALICGTIRRNLTKGEKPLYNTAAIMYDGKLIGFQDKSLLPTYDVFDERRYFEPAEGTKTWVIGPYRIGITICEDIWQHSNAITFSDYPFDPIKELKGNSLDLHINLSGSPFYAGKLQARFQVVQHAAISLNCPVILCNQVGGNDSVIFDGHSLMVNAEGKLSLMTKGFEEDLVIVDTESTQHSTPKEDYLPNLYQALILGIKDYFAKQGFTKACIGLSGGVDSALVACLAKAALGESNVLGVAMPSRYSSKDSLEDAEELAKRLGIKFSTIPIESPFTSFLNLLEPHFENKEPGTTEENMQARIRGMILMALSNKYGYIVLSTGNKSELALGYSTLYGDMCGGLAVISDLLKEQIYALSRYINELHSWIPERILTKEPSAELRPNQKDSDSLPQYPVVDAILKAYIEQNKSPEEIIEEEKIAPEVVYDLIKRIHRNEYKRRQSPPGLKVSEKAFSAGRRFPIVQKFI